MPISNIGNSYNKVCIILFISSCVMVLQLTGSTGTLYLLRSSSAIYVASSEEGSAELRIIAKGLSSDRIQNEIIFFDICNDTKIVEEIDHDKVIGTAVDNKRIAKLYRDTNELFSDKTMIEVKESNGKVVGNGEVSGTAQSLQMQGKTLAVVLTDRIDFVTEKGNYISSIFISSDYKDMKLFKDGSYACIQTNDEIAIYKIR